MRKETVCIEGWLSFLLTEESKGWFEGESVFEIGMLRFDGRFLGFGWRVTRCRHDEKCKKKRLMRELLWIWFEMESDRWVILSMEMNFFKEKSCWWKRSTGCRHDHLYRHTYISMYTTVDWFGHPTPAHTLNPAPSSEPWGWARTIICERSTGCPSRPERGCPQGMLTFERPGMYPMLKNKNKNKIKTVNYIKIM